MSPTDSTLCRFGEFAAALRFDDLSASCKRLATCQFAGIAAAWAYGFRSDEVKAVARGFGCRLPEAGEFHLPSSDRDDALLGTLAAASMVHDFDDYLFCGHTGHSAVACAILSRPDSGKELLARVVLGNEIGGRVGAASFLGPHNGQLWSYIHLAAAAAIRGRALGLDAEGIAHALAIAFSQVPFPLSAAFMGHSTKLLTAALPAVQGWRAAELAAKGVRGNLSLFEERGGFLREIPFVPLPALAGGLGKAWLTETLTFKQHPGCAYLGPILDCLAMIRKEGAIDPEAVGRITVESTFLTAEMDEMSRSAREERTHLDPVLVGFSVADALALDLLKGGFEVEQMDGAALKAASLDTGRLASRVRLIHDWKRSIDLLETVAATIPLGQVFGAISFRDLRLLRREMRRRHGKTLAIGLWTATQIARSLSLREGLSLFSWLLRRLVRKPNRPFDLGLCDMASLRLPIGAKVTIEETCGRTRSAECRLPEGSPGTVSRFDVPWQKLDRALFGCRQAEAILSDIKGLPATFSGRLLQPQDGEARPWKPG